MTKKFFQRPWLLVVLVLIALALGLMQLAQNSNLFPIKVVKVYGSYNNVSQENLKAIIQQQVNKGYFAVDISSIQNDVAQLPWVSRVSVTRSWPDTLTVTIKQKQAIAIWDNTALLLKNATLFYPVDTTFPPNIPSFVGPSGQQKIVIKMFDDMSKKLANSHLQITTITLSSEGVWQLTLNDKTVVMLGDNDILARLERFIEVNRQQFEAKQEMPTYVDMRYNHGLAVKWD
jgi:cell division protein FtsQ